MGTRALAAPVPSRMSKGPSAPPCLRAHVMLSCLCGQVLTTANGVSKSWLGVDVSESMLTLVAEQRPKPLLALADMSR